MIQSIGAFAYAHDIEYQKIIQELMKLGITPSGNKMIDKSKLENAKTELIEKIQTKQEQEQKENIQVQPLEAVQDTKRAEMEELRVGAMTVAELNRLYFGI